MKFSMKPKKIRLPVLALLIAILFVQIAMPVYAALPDGVQVLDSSGNPYTDNNGSVSITANGGFLNPATTKFSIKNTYEGNAIISFDYTCDKVNSASGIDKNGGTYSAQFSKGQAVELSIKSNGGISGNTATITLSNFQVIPEQHINVTFNPAEYYSVTNGVGSTTYLGYTVNEQTVAEDKAYLFSEVSSMSDFDIVEPTNYHLAYVKDATGRQFYPGADGKIKLTDVNADISLTPVFVCSESSVAPFLVNGVGYWFWEEAFVAAGTSNTVIVNANYTLPGTLDANNLTGNGKYVKLVDGKLTYTVPTGVTLLVPYDDNNTLVTSSPKSSAMDKYKSKVLASEFRSLTLESGVHIYVDGAISVAGTHSSEQKSNGMPAGPLGYIKTEEGSGITVNEGGNLYAWGYITGGGTVTVKNGGTVYENLQIVLWRGGSKAGTLISNKAKKVFMFNQYYIQNIEANLTLEAGATENVYTSASGYTTSATLVGTSEGLFRPQTGSTITRSFTNSRTTYTINGNVSMSSMTVKVENKTMNSAEYVMPLNSNLSVDVQSGHITINTDIGILPGSEIRIQENAKMSLVDGAKLIAYDTNQWFGDFCSGAGAVSAYINVHDSNNKKPALSKADALIEVKGTLDASDGALYTTYGPCIDAGSTNFGTADGGANICGSNNGKLILKAGTETVVYQYVQVKSAASKEGFAQIPIEPAKLKNADATFTEYVQSGTNTYTYVEDHWVCETHTIVDNKCTVCGYEESGCVHVWNEATCTAPKTCSLCGETEGEALGHEWAETLTKGDSTHWYDCTRDDCNEKKDEAEHSYEWVTTNPATCVAKGLETGTCACGATTTREIEVSENAHDLTTVPAQDATCTNPGWNEYQKCLRDGCNYSTYEEISAGHSLVQVEAKAATCTEAGYEAYEYCTACEYTTRGQDIPALGHDYDVVVTEPTCTEAGYTTYTCACGDTYVADEVAALGHNYESVVTEPNFDEQGYTTHTCTRCGDSYVDKYTGPLVAVAQIGDTKYETLAAAIKVAQENDKIELLADATGTGNFEAIILPAGVTLDLNGRTFTGAVAGRVKLSGGTLKTYADDGVTVYTMAGPEGSNANYITSDAVFVMEANWNLTIESGSSTLGADWQTMPNQTVTIQSGATVTIPENTTFTVRGYVIVETGATVVCNGKIVLANVDATVTGPEGLNVITNAGDTVLYQEGMYVVHVHSYWEAWKSDANGHWHACSCDVKGSFEAHTSSGAATEDAAEVCIVCDYVITPKLEHVHSMTKNDAQDPTCATPGNREYWTCSGCSKYFSDAEGKTEIEKGSWVIPALNHVDTAVTYTDNGDGTHSVICACEDVIETESHSYDETTGECVCGAVKKSGCEIGNHTYTNEADSICDLCGEEREDVIPISDGRLKFSGNYLSFQEYIGMQPLIAKTVLNKYDIAYVKAVQTPVNGTTQKAITLDVVEYNKSYKLVDMKVMAWDMTDNISMTLYAVTADGIVYEGQTLSTSVEELALEKLGQLAGDSKYERNCRILVDMLNYGAAVQTAFDHNAANLPNTQLEAYSRFATTQTPEFNAEVTSTGTSTLEKDLGVFISMQAQVELQMYIKLKNTDSIEKYELRVSPANGGETVVYDYTTFTSQSGYYVPRFALKAVEFRNDYTMAVYNKETGEAVTKIYTASVEAKAQLALSDAKNKPVAIAMMKYGDAVRDYVANS